MAEPFVGQVYLVGFDFAARGFALCDGSIQSIASNTTLFSLIGTTYGGNGTTTFALPDLRGRVPIGQGTGPGLSPHPIGERSGFETTTLTTANMPSHSHPATLIAEAAEASDTDPSGKFLAQANIYREPGRGGSVSLSPSSVQVGLSGGNMPVENMQPYLVMNYQIAMVGIYPSRN